MFGLSILHMSQLIHSLLTATTNSSSFSSSGDEQDTTYLKIPPFYQISKDSSTLLVPHEMRPVRGEDHELCQFQMEGLSQPDMKAHTMNFSTKDHIPFHVAAGFFFFSIPTQNLKYVIFTLL